MDCVLHTRNMSINAPLKQILSSYNECARLSEASTIPASWYIDPRIAELERVNVFGRTWQLVARTDQLSQPGQFVSTQLAGEPVVVVRGQDGELRAFFNVCRLWSGFDPAMPVPWM
jgi:choline monooxygenase